MSSKGTLSLTDLLQYSDSIPSSFDGFGNYQHYPENVILWNAMTSVSLGRRAPADYSWSANGTSSGNRQNVTADRIDVWVSSLLREMGKTFVLDTGTFLYNNISHFFD